MKQSFKWKALPLNANDNSFLNTKITFTPEVLEYDENVPYEVMEVICDYFNKLEKDYVSRSNIKNEKIKNEEPRLKAIKKQIIDCQRFEEKAQTIIRWLKIKRREGVEEPKGTKWVVRSERSGWANGLPEDASNDEIKEDND